MRLFVVTPIYASTTSKSGTTPVVHYFTKEWVKNGIEVHVFFIRSKFPRLYYFISRIFQHKLNSFFGSLVPVEYPTDLEYKIDGVIVHRYAINKVFPHSRYSHKTVKRIADRIITGFREFGTPDAIIGHWHNPSLDIISELRARKISTRTCLVLHENSFMMEKYYGNELHELFKSIDVVGFRNRTAQDNYISKYGSPKYSFIAYSGVSSYFINAGYSFQPTFENGVDRFVFVGSLIARKNPSTIVRALNTSFLSRPYSITFIGDGAEKKNIILEAKGHSNASLFFTGRVDRNSIIDYLKESQVFVMVSRDEVFGLVYLEAMALGLIPIGSRGEGIDGIIVDGQNGFLCNPGNETELSMIFDRISKMMPEELLELSHNAKTTAQKFSDSNVAKQYIQSVIN